MNSLITISRDSGYADRIRSYKVAVDGAEIGTIGNGESKTFSIQPGPHKLVLKIDWCSTNTVSFDLPSEGSVNFECGSNLRGAALAGDTYATICRPIRGLQS